jgi:hypothetical protein
MSATHSATLPSPSPMPKVERQNVRICYLNCCKVNCAKMTCAVKNCTFPGLQREEAVLFFFGITEPQKLVCNTHRDYWKNIMNSVSRYNCFYINFYSAICGNRLAQKRYTFTNDLLVCVEPFLREDSGIFALSFFID